MRYLRADGDYTEIGDAWDSYLNYLNSIRSKLGEEVYEFASSLWHYDPANHRSLHDAWVEEVLIAEEAIEASHERSLRITIRLIGPYHDGHHQLSYDGVRTYQIALPSQPNSSGSGIRPDNGHGDWLIDEVRLSDDGVLVHEVQFSSGAKWRIECRSMKHSTSIPDLRE